jgi:putative dehydrogenase
MITVAVVAMGEMGAGVARRLVEHGARVVTSLEGRSAASVARAESAGVEALTDAELIHSATIFLSIVPPSLAADVAARFLEVIERSANKPLFIDCNAIAPDTLQAIAQPFTARRLPFGDAGILGGPPKGDGSGPRIYVSGPILHEVDSLKALGLDIRVMSSALGHASALKLAYAGVTKGFQAIGVSMALGAARAGVAEIFTDELRESQPQLYGWLSKMLPAMYAKAYRWDGEMREIAKFLEPERGAADMLAGAAALYQRVGQDHIGPEPEIIPIIERFVKPAG